MTQTPSPPQWSDRVLVAYLDWFEALERAERLELFERVLAQDEPLDDEEAEE